MSLVDGKKFTINLFLYDQQIHHHDNLILKQSTGSPLLLIFLNVQVFTVTQKFKDSLFLFCGLSEDFEFVSVMKTLSLVVIFKNS